MESAKKNLIYLVIIVFSISTTMHLWKKNSAPKTQVQDAGYDMAYDGGLEYMEEEMSVDSDIKKKEGANKEDSGAKNAEAMEFSAKKARDSVRKSNLNYIYSQLLIYYDEHGGSYPIGGEKMVRLNDTESAVYKDLVPGYVSENLMKDPNDPNDKSCIQVNDLCIYKYNSQGEVSGE